MELRVITNGAVSADTGTLECDSQVLGGILITTNNTNQGVVIIKRDNASGKEVVKISTITTMWITAPFSLEGTTTLYYDVSGTGCEVHLYKWVQ